MMRLSFLWVAALVAAAPPLSLHAHDIPPEVLAYLKVEGARLRVLVRVPVAFLPDARFPLRADGYLDLQRLEVDPTILTGVASEVARNLDVMEGDRPVPSLRATSRISRAPNTSFDSYDEALAHLVAPRLPPDTRVDPAAALVDLELEYPVAVAERLSIRVNGLRLATRASRMQTRYLTADGETRNFLTSGVPRRVDLEPRLSATAAAFLRLGAGQFAVTGLHVLFIFCLAIPPRSLSGVLAAFMAFATGCGFTLVLSALAPGSGDQSPLVPVLQALTGIALIIAALQNITGARFSRVRAAAAAFGVFDGLLIGLTFRDSVQFAGGHLTASILVYAATILIGSLWLLILAHPIIGLVHRTKFPERWAVVCLSAIPIHAGLHSLLVGQ
jgi:hypothetical protein